MRSLALSPPSRGRWWDTWRRPAIGKTFRLAFTMAKLSTLWAGVNPRMSPQNASPSGTVFASAGERYSGARPAERPLVRERQLQDGS